MLPVRELLNTFRVSHLVRVEEADINDRLKVVSRRPESRAGSKYILEEAGSGVFVDAGRRVRGTTFGDDLYGRIFP